MIELQVQQHHIATLGGVVFAQVWTHDLAQGAPIVLLHDSLGCVALWRDFPAQLVQATGRAVVAYDRLGFGRSSAYSGTLPVSFIADEAQHSFAAVRDYLGLDRYVLLGHSVGGGMAVCVAAAYPEQCMALMTLSAQSLVQTHTTEGIRQAKLQFQQPEAMNKLCKYHGEKAQWVLNAWTETWLSEEFSSWSLDGCLPQVQCPTLVIHGALDEYGTEEHALRIEQGVRGQATLALLPNCGHVPQREHTERCLALIRQHLADPSDIGADG